jgi:hypothetical protein
MSRSSFEQVVEAKSIELVLPKVPAFVPSAQIHGRVVRTKVVGVSYEGRQEVVARLQLGDRVWLEREADNPFDANAIKVCRSNGEQFGYLNRYLAANIALWIDVYGKPVRGKVHLLTGSASDGYTLGVIVVFKLPKMHEKHHARQFELDDWED